MQLTTEKSLCEEKQKLIVSKDKGTSREHRAKMRVEDIMSGIISWMGIL